MKVLIIIAILYLTISLITTYFKILGNCCAISRHADIIKNKKKSLVKLTLDILLIIILIFI